MKINNIIFAFIILSTMIFSSCDSFLDPMPEQRLSEENLTANPGFAEGLLLRAYKTMPTNYDFVLDVAADDAVNNKPGSAVNTMVNGGWTSSTSLTNQWGKSYEMFYYIHKFMEIAPKVEWDWRSNQRDSLFAVRLMGEAYALRAYWGFELLKAHGGLVGTELLGYPIVTKVLSASDNLKLPRNTYADCVKQILMDLDEAIVRLPLIWKDRDNVAFPPLTTKFPNAIYNETMGAKYTNRINGITAKHLKARVLLYAASPAFSASGYTWTQAAEAAAAVMLANGGLSNITAAKASDLEFYKSATSAEIIWSSSKSISQTGWAKANYPPSLYGSGETNPTQNFVETFPMIDGKPYVKDSNISVNQYKNRDPRLAKYVVHNGLTFSAVVMKFSDDALNINAPGRNENASLSGYYLKKFVNEAVKIDPKNPTVGVDQFYTYARYTETLLNFAEAANEAVGPDGLIPVYTYTARGVINAIRTRAGITSTAYINGLDKDGLRTAIKNERRIELCFEGHRFWDIRRWNNIELMKSPVSGVKFNALNTAASVSQIQVRDYQDYMIYSPIPYGETLKYDLKQNNGWQ